MKLFQNLLIAPAALGLLTPITANASEVNLNEISNYTDVESVEFANSFDAFNNSESKVDPLLAGGEGLVDDHSHDGSFSETTTASFSADMYVGSVDGGDFNTSLAGAQEDSAVMAGYSFQIDLNTSFTGEDSLDISLDAGNASGTGIAEFDGNSTASDRLQVDGVSYTFPVGESITMIVGDNTDGSALFTTACVYGGPSNTLDDCGNVNAGITNGGAAVGASYDFGNGITTAVGYAGPEGGIATLESADAYGINAAYTADTYGVSVTYGIIDQANVAHGADNNDFSVNKYTALNAYYTPEGFPSISIGYEIGDLGGAEASVDETEGIFIGVSGEVGPGEAGVAYGTKTPTVEDADEEYMYEVYYSYPINDGMTVTPLFYSKENATTGVDDETGVMVKTSFSF